MKRYGSILILLLMIFGCRNQLGYSGDEEYISPFTDAMESVIDEFIDYVGPIDSSYIDERTLYYLSFYKEKDTCCFYITPSPFYYKERTLGYVIRNGHTIVVGNDEMRCLNQVVDVSKLIIYQDTIPNHYDSSYWNRNITYDPPGIRAKIISPDSIDIFWKGGV